MIRIEIDPFPDSSQLDALWRAGWGSPAGSYRKTVLSRSLAHLGAYDDDRLVGFVNVAWDGGVHAFLLDTVVHPDFRHRGIASDLVRRATEIARDRGAHWLHVDHEPHLDGFYRTCGFRPTHAGLIALT